ncbi:MAG: hypothetical protein VB068_06370 [Petrimonas sp.]|nr:hypothetical protein [Petrimonas sp.]
MQKGTFNTIAQNTTQFGGAKVIWARVRELFQGGGKIDHTKYAPGTVIPAGTMVKFNGPGKEMEIITANGSAGAAEVDTLTVLTGATTAGNITIKLAGGSNKTVALTTDEDTPAKVAAKIAVETFTGFMAVADGETVVFTKNVVGAVAAPVFTDTGTTGVTAEFEVTVAGMDADGSNLEDVNGLTFEDVCIPDGAIHATCAVVRAGRIYADRVEGGGLPASIEKQLPMIEFVRED